MRGHLLALFGMVIIVASAAAIPMSADAKGDDPERGGNTSQEFVLPTFELAKGVFNGVHLNDGIVTLAQGRTKGVYVSAPILTPQSFSAVGLHWQTKLDVGTYQLRLRTSADGDNWTPWADLTTLDEVEFGANGDIFAPLLVVPSPHKTHHYLQLGVEFNLTGFSGLAEIETITAFLTDTTNGPTTEESIAAQQALDASKSPSAVNGVPKPTVISRTAWRCPDGQTSTWSPQYVPVTHMIVHHSAGINSASDWASVVRGIWEYHARSLGWKDIGYNYLIDPNGNIYEGRAGGDDVVAGHAYGYNEGTMGINLLGCFDSQACGNGVNVTPTTQALNSTVALMAWKADQRRLDPTGSADLKGQQRNVILGHRDVNTTACPGNNLYGRLPYLRTETKNRIFPPVTSCPVGQFLVEYYPNKDLAGSPTFRRCESKIEYVWGTGGPGYGIGSDYFSLRGIGRFYFQVGTYQFSAGADNGIRLSVDGQQVVNGTSTSFTQYCASRSMTAGEHEIRFEYVEERDLAAVKLPWARTENLVWRCQAYATTPQGDNYLAARRATDGEVATLWRSDTISSLGEQWWKADLNTARTFDRVRIQWDGAYAADYCVYTSNDRYTGWEGRCYARSSSGNVVHNLGSRTARYIAVHMKRPPSGGTSYAIREVEAYRPGVVIPAAHAEAVALPDASPVLASEGAETNGDMIVPVFPEETLPRSGVEIFEPK